jgi:phosphate transport system substrate-binding protein
MKNRARITVLTCWIFLLAAVVCSSVAAQELLRVSGATTIQPTAERAAALYAERTSDRAIVSGGGSGGGVRDVLEGRSHIGMVSRSLTPAEAQQLTAVTYGFDALVFVVNLENPLQGITRNQVRAIFSGATTNWRELTGWDHPIVLVSKEIGRATLDLFEGYTGMTHPKRSTRGAAGSIDSRAYEIAANIEAATLAGGIPGAIAYLSLGTAEQLIAAGMPIRVLTLDGVAAGTQTLTAGTYPIIRELNLVMLKQTDHTRKFTDLFFSSDLRHYIQTTGVVPAGR